DLPRPGSPLLHTSIGRPRPAHVPGADHANVIAGVMQSIRGLQHARAGRKMSGCDDADSRAHMASAEPRHECSRRCASSTSPTLSSMTYRGIWNGSQALVAKDGPVANARSK